MFLEVENASVTIISFTASGDQSHCQAVYWKLAPSVQLSQLDKVNMVGAQLTLD